MEESVLHVSYFFSLSLSLITVCEKTVSSGNLLYQGLWFIGPQRSNCSLRGECRWGLRQSHWQSVHWRTQCLCKLPQLKMHVAQSSRCNKVQHNRSTVVHRCLCSPELKECDTCASVYEFVWSRVCMCLNEWTANWVKARERGLARSHLLGQVSELMASGTRQHALFTPCVTTHPEW